MVCLGSICSPYSKQNIEPSKQERTHQDTCFFVSIFTPHNFVDTCNNKYIFLETKTPVRLQKSISFLPYSLLTFLFFCLLSTLLRVTGIYRVCRSRYRATIWLELLKSDWKGNKSTNYLKLLSLIQKSVFRYVYGRGLGQDFCFNFTIRVADLNPCLLARSGFMI